MDRLGSAIVQIADRITGELLQNAISQVLNKLSNSFDGALGLVGLWGGVVEQVCHPVRDKGAEQRDAALSAGLERAIIRRIDSQQSHNGD